jgi:hypothetical protein
VGRLIERYGEESMLATGIRLPDDKFAEAVHGAWTADTETSILAVLLLPDAGSWKLEVGQPCHTIHHIVSIERSKRVG